MTKGSWPRREFPQPSNHITALYALCSSPPACWKKNVHICPQKAIASEYKCCHAKATQARWQKIGVKKCFYTSSTKSPFLSDSKRKQEKKEGKVEGKWKRSQNTLPHKRFWSHGSAMGCTGERSFEWSERLSSDLDWSELLSNWQWVIMTKMEIEVTWKLWDLHNVLPGAWGKLIQKEVKEE